MPSAMPLSVPVHANQLKAVDEVCSAALGCNQADVIGQLLLLVVSGLLAVVVLAVAVHIREARSNVTEERSRTVTERHAFDRFARKVARLDPSNPAVNIGPSTGATAAVSASAPPDRAIEGVRSAYEETVIAMDHYEEEYNEPIAEHMSRELGEEVATAVFQSRQLTPSLQQELINRSREAARDRERLITSLDRESEALDKAEDELVALGDTIEEARSRSLDDWSFPELSDEWNRLGEIDSRLSRIVTERQQSLNENRDSVHQAEALSLNAYLYEQLDTNYPILTDATALASRLEDVRRRVLVALTNRA